MNRNDEGPASDRSFSDDEDTEMMTDADANSLRQYLEDEEKWHQAHPVSDEWIAQLRANMIKEANEGRDM